MVRVLLCILIGLQAQTLNAQVMSEQQIKAGDLLFQNLDCGPLCDAIEKVTRGYKDLTFSHIGLVKKQGDSLVVIEAIGKDVHATPLRLFVKRSSHPVYIGRVKKRYRYTIGTALAFADSKNGVIYDDVFLYNNDKYYCSELIYDAFMYAYNGKPFFSLQPMTFCEPGTTSFFPVWEAYYKDLGVAVPEGKPGINPGGISASRKIKMIGTIQ
jgi:hypothetical protein